MRAARTPALLVLAHAAHALVDGPWSDPATAPEHRARKLLANMTLEEKISLLHGHPSGKMGCGDSQTCAYIGNVAAVPRLGIPPITMNDGPQGFRDPRHKRTTTAFPSGLTIAASWDREAVFLWGMGMGKEFFDKGANVQLGPGLNLARVPRNGRNFEYMSGEDPFLGYALVKQAVWGIQSQKVVANAKHYVLNNQEANRNEVSSEIDERTRFEMYYPPFEGAIEAGVGSFMCSYNKINGAWACENPMTLAHDLKKVLGFKGYVMSDWGATHSTSIMAGLDNEQPGATWMNEELIKPAISSGAITEAAIDDSAFRILLTMFSVGVMDVPTSTWDFRNLERNVTSESATSLVRHLSSLSTVLLRNQGGVLPLPRGAHLAVIGLADENAIVYGTGSGEVIPSYVSTPLEGIRAAVGEEATVEFDDGSDALRAAALAESSDYAIVFVGTISGEGNDRVSLSLDSGTAYTEQNALVAAVAAAAGPKTVVVASVPGAVLMPWSQDVAAILTNFIPGQQAGNAVADVLFGKVSPSGKLPVTFPNTEDETKPTQAQYPGLPDAGAPRYVFYTEKLLVGYRYYDAHNISFTTGFPFGHGLSYTTFGYSALAIETHLAHPYTTVSCILENTGAAPGAEVAQLYLKFPQSAGEPPLQLKNFHKTKVLAPGQKEQINFSLRPRDMSVWDSHIHSWWLVKGQFSVLVGSSSRDIRLTGTFESKSHDNIYT